MSCVPKIMSNYLICYIYYLSIFMMIMRDVDTAPMLNRK